MKIPDDISPVLREIDQSLKENGIPPHSRPIMAVIEFGKKFHISLPLAKLPPGAPAELIATSVHTENIYRWYKEVYGDLLKTDFSEKAKVAVCADGDLWEMRIPLIYGMVTIEAKRDLPKETGNRIGTQLLNINACASLAGITKARLQHFSDKDLNEVYGLFVVGLDVRDAFKRFRKADPMFAAAEEDWFAAVGHMTNQSPNWGQARWSSLQMTEKFMKGMIAVIGDYEVPWGHKLKKPHDILACSIQGLDLRHLIAEIQCDASVRYNDPNTPSTRQQAYAAHKASLLVIRALGDLQYRQNR
ncbi:hypothetical protein [Tritonibacter mobilis]|uniref:hypothetical protein n=1 Tax=Tritonibacter mobilis TaxID=379347 RepID=UPI0001B8A2EA|nr:hypothetical protein [Tritonibacter mobilis]EEW60948.1 conserved hypothetical protein [Ruegeria sp. TrichCH4B]NHM20367.1 hypothetical protein [Tritonibacter mobilis]NHM24531.1 hypothetical protein [Tritonibacter mobilis]